MAVHARAQLSLVALTPPRRPAPRTPVMDLVHHGEGSHSRSGRDGDGYGYTHTHTFEKQNCKDWFTCNGCETSCKGETYSCKTCSYYLHADCYFALTSSNTIIFRGEDCQFFKKPRKCRSCEACGNTIKGFLYYCEKNNRYFHPSCAKLENEIKLQNLWFTLQTRGSLASAYTCFKCDRTHVKGFSENKPGWSYVSNDNSCRIHVHCLLRIGMSFSSANTNLINNNNGASSSSTSSTLALNNNRLRRSATTTSRETTERFRGQALVEVKGAHHATFVITFA